MLKVSVLMTAYNRQQYIAQAIESVLASDFEDFEFIIVDDYSTDSTFDIILSYAKLDKRISAFRNPHNLGDYANRNVAARHAHGHYIKFVDSDDIIYSYALRVMLKMMDEYPSAALGICRPAGVEPYPTLLTPREAYKTYFFGRSGVFDLGPLGVIIRAKIFFEKGMFRDARYIGDTECWLRIAKSHDILILPNDLVWWRKHAAQEFQRGIKDMLYPVGNYLIHRNIFVDEESPLLADDRINLLKNLRLHTLISIIKAFPRARWKYISKMISVLKLDLQSKRQFIDLNVIYG